jgi:hypothetical protein
LLFVCSLSGCGDGLASVTGTVTLGDRLLAGGSDVNGTVCFTPVGGGPLAVGTIDATGHFSLATGTAGGVRPGKYLVAISATTIIPSKVAGMPASGRPLTPAKYANAKQSGLQADVRPGENTLDFQLESSSAR